MINTRLGRARLIRALAATGALAALAGSVQVVQAGTASASAVTQVVSAGSATDSTAKKQVSASCPAGTRVFGGGGDIVGGGHAVALSGLRPQSVLLAGHWVDSFVAIAEEEPTGYAAAWSVYAYAVCGVNATNLSIQHGTQTSTGADRVYASASCPAGTAPLGMGAEIGSGYGHVVLNSLLANYTGGPYGAPTGWASAAAFIDEHGFAGSWNLTSYAVCATPQPGLTYRFADSANNTADDKSASVECPAGTRAYGAGGYISYLNGQVHLDRVVPHGATWTGTDIEARTDSDGFGYPWFTEVEAICAA
jgi:hypothetical protein